MMMHGKASGPARLTLAARRVLVLALLGALAAPGCAGNGNGWHVRGPEQVEDVELDAFIEAGVWAELPPVDQDEAEFKAIVLEYRGVARDMVEATEAATAPLVLLLSAFAKDGIVDLLLDVFPVHRLGDAYQAGKHALKARRQRKLTQKLVDEFQDLLEDDARRFLKWAEHLARRDIQALKKIHGHTRSFAVVNALMRQHVGHKADVHWILKKLEGHRLDPVEARRFTFDADLVEDITEYKAGLSWKTLEDVIEGRDVDEGLRGSLASKVAGFLGERAARDWLYEAGTSAKLFERQGATVQRLRRGVRYAGGGSMDIVAYSDQNELLVGEVKNWAIGTWLDASKRGRLIDQLRRHNEAIAEIGRKSDRQPVGKTRKVLFLSEGGLSMWEQGPERLEFEKAVDQLGWTVEIVPEQRIGTLATLIDDLR